MAERAPDTTRSPERAPRAEALAARAALGPLAARAALGLDAGRVDVHEVSDLALVTIALPRDAARGDALRRRLERAYGVALPDIGRSTLGEGGARLLGLQHDRVFVLFAAGDAAAPEAAAPDATTPEQAVRARLADVDERSGEASNGPEDTCNDTLLMSDQSDAWAALRVSGPRCRRALERLCPLDLHEEAWPVDAVARTVMEHLPAIVLREAPDAYLLLSPRSSAGSFLHAVERAAANVRGRP